MKQRRWGKRGATQVVVVVALPALLGMGALAVDIGHLVVAKQHLQQVCDAAAWAGGASLPTDAVGDGGADAVQAAEQCAQVNGVTLHAQAQPPHANSGWQLQVAAKEDVPMAFARIWGWDSRSVLAQATAEREPEAGWVPLALEARVIGRRTDIAISRCDVGQWWVTRVGNGPAIPFAADFKAGASVPLNAGDNMELLGDTPSEYTTDVVDAAQTRLAEGRAVVRVPIIANVPPTADPHETSSPFQRYALARITGVDSGPHPALHLQWLDTGSGPLGKGDAVTGGLVRLVR